ncbi:MAG: hypothetical protein AAGG48_13530 [Planctomycetota bacterium]
MLASSIIPTVLLPVWVAVTLWFVGAFARVTSGERAERLYAWSWMLGSLAMWIHIFASYAVVYHWCHAEALQATAEESERVTGIRAGWGVYVNFVFALVWSIYSALLVKGGTRQLTTDRAVFWFTAAIVLMATVVFEAGAVRIASGVGFLAFCAVALSNARRD